MYGERRRDLIKYALAECRLYECDVAYIRVYSARTLFENFLSSLSPSCFLPSFFVFFLFLSLFFFLRFERRQGDDMPATQDLTGASRAPVSYLTVVGRRSSRRIYALPGSSTLSLFHPSSLPLSISLTHARALKPQASDTR